MLVSCVCWVSTADASVREHGVRILYFIFNGLFFAGAEELGRGSRSGVRGGWHGAVRALVPRVALLFWGVRGAATPEATL